MTSLQEAAVSERFDVLEARFKDEVSPDDSRLLGLVQALGPMTGRRVLDLGCGKGRFAARLAARGARVVGLDLSAAMLARAEGLDRVRGSARRLPFATGSFEAVVAVEVVQHLHPASLGSMLGEVARVLRPGGVVAVVDRNAAASDLHRPWLPALAIKWLDQRRGRWMYPVGGPARERWPWPASLGRALGRRFEGVRVEFLLSPSEAGCWWFRRVPIARRMALWTARKPGGNRV